MSNEVYLAMVGKNGGLGAYVLGTRKRSSGLPGWVGPEVMRDYLNCLS